MRQNHQITGRQREGRGIAEFEPTVAGQNGIEANHSYGAHVDGPRRMRLEPSILGAAYPQRLEHIGQDVLSHRGFSLLAECGLAGRIRRRSHFLTVAPRSS